MEHVRLATEASDKKHKREVCRYWMQSKCMKGSNCEFLHTLDYTKMPVCPLGDMCLNQNDCPYKHMDPTRAECSNYQLGFCSFGKRCPHRHVERSGPAPDISDYWLHSYSALERNRSLANSKTFRRKQCDYFVANGWCPYFDMCNFSH